MSLLSEETRRALATVRPSAPLFPNPIMAEMHDAECSRGPYKILPTVDGGWVVFDTRAALGRGVVGKRHGNLGAAKEALSALEPR